MTDLILQLIDLLCTHHLLYDQRHLLGLLFHNLSVSLSEVLHLLGVVVSLASCAAPLQQRLEHLN